MRTFAGFVIGVLIIIAVAYQAANQSASDALPPASPLRFDADRIADELAKEHPEPAIPGHYPEGCTAGQHRWATPVQGFVLDWCAIEIHTDRKGNVAATADVDSPVQRGFMEKAHRVVRYDFDCAGHFAIDLSPPMPLTGIFGAPPSAPELIGNAVCIRARQLLYERAQKGR
jgi:hypothetical protein